ncbi:putative ribonuclease E/G family protein [Rhizobium phage RHph_I4]|nr:putative ribonuclease E/G family protein [Rhizobium phage RHph_I4]
MNRQPRARIMKAKALTSPEPEFVSMVRAGANQEPVRVIKMDTGINEILALFEAKEISMPDAVKKLKAESHDIAQLVFKGGQFPDRASVDAWLKAGGYEGGYEVVEKKDGETAVFEVSSTVTKFKTGTIKKVKGQADGLIVFVGEIEGEVLAEKSEDEKAAEEAAAKGSAITAAKSDKDETDTSAGTETSAKETSEEAATTEAAKSEAVEPGATVAADFAVTVAKADKIMDELRSKTATIYDVSSLGGVINTLRWMVNDATYEEIPEETVTKLKTAANVLLDVLVDYANQAIGVLAEAFKTDAAPAATETAAKAEEVVTQKTTEEPAAPVSTLDPALAEILKGIQSSVADLATAVKAQGEEIAEVKTKAAEVAEEASNKGQTRKGADVVQPAATEGTETKQKQDVAQAHAERRLRSAFGSYKGTGFDNL